MLAFLSVAVYYNSKLTTFFISFIINDGRVFE